MRKFNSSHPRDLQKEALQALEKLYADQDIRERIKSINSHNRPNMQKGKIILLFLQQNDVGEDVLRQFTEWAVHPNDGFNNLNITNNPLPPAVLRKIEIIHGLGLIEEPRLLSPPAPTRRTFMANTLGWAAVGAAAGGAIQLQDKGPYGSDETGKKCAAFSSGAVKGGSLSALTHRLHVSLQSQDKKAQDREAEVAPKVVLGRASMDTLVKYAVAALEELLGPEKGLKR